MSLVTATLLATRDATAEPIRLLVAAGSREGLSAEEPLRYAHHDAARVRDVLVALGDVRREHVVFLTEPTPAELFAAFERARTMAVGHAPGEVTLLFYFSGHGDRDALHVRGTRVPVRELTDRIAAVPAGLRIAITDACRSTRDKGVSAEPPFAVAVSALPQAAGTVWLHASADGEAAQESDALRGAIFTHAWVNGLRGAADGNGDARVTLDESFSFAHAQTLLRSANSSGVLQTPQAILDLHAASPVVLTHTTARRARLGLPAGRDEHFLILAGGAPAIVADVWSAADRHTWLSLPPGPYVVHRRQRGTAMLARVEVPAEGERMIGDADFAPTSAEPLARKGAPVEGDAAADALGGGPRAPDLASARPDDLPIPRAADSATPRPGDVPRLRPHHEIAAGWDVTANARGGVLNGPAAAYTLRLSEPFGIRFAGAYGTSEIARTPLGAEPLSERLRVARLHTGVEWRLPRGPLTFRAGAGAALAVLWQTVERRDRALLLVDGYVTDRERTAAGGGPEAFLGARVGSARAGAPGSVFADLGLRGGMLFIEQGGRPRAFGEVGLAAMLGVHF